MTRFWLVRHGPTHAKAMVGWTDLPADLSDTELLSRLDAHLPAAPVISSDLVRAVATADCLAPRHRLPHDPALRELNFGRWEGRNWAEAEAEDPDLARRFWEKPGPVRAPGGECWDELTTRVASALERLAGLEEVIVVAHFGVIAAAIQIAGGLEPEAAMGHRIDNLSVTTLTLTPPKVFAINHRP